MIPQGRWDKVRFQVTIEIDYKTERWIRPSDSRAASGHTNWCLLDPSRIAGAATQGLIRYCPGIFHMTKLSKVSLILRDGLMPGCRLSHKGRADVHFSPFPPMDIRNGMMRKKLEQIKRTGEPWAVISLDPRKCGAYRMRYCTANGILLCNQTFQPRAFDCVWSFRHDGTEWLEQWIYEDSLEHVNVIGYRGGTVALACEIAQLLCSTNEDIKEMTRKCETDAGYFDLCHKRAKVCPISSDEKQYWDGQPIRRCPACVNASPSRGATCLWCAAEWLCKVESSPVSTIDEDDEDHGDHVIQEETKEAKAPVAAPEERARPAVVSTAGDFPSALGVKWDLVEDKSWGTMVNPTKRQGSGVAGESVAGLATFLDFR
jgi:hypothetical protein